MGIFSKRGYWHVVLHELTNGFISSNMKPSQKAEFLLNKIMIVCGAKFAGSHPSKTQHTIKRIIVEWVRSRPKNVVDALAKHLHAKIAKLQVAGSIRNFELRKLCDLRRSLGFSVPNGTKRTTNRSPFRGGRGSAPRRRHAAPTRS